MVTMLAIIVNMVSEPMLPPSFSATTTTADAVGQMKHINIPSRTSFHSEFEPKIYINKTMNEANDVLTN